jgi:hypothetical protein
VHSRLRAEQEMRDHRLRSLELRAAAAVAAVRHGSSGGGGSSGGRGAHGQNRVVSGRSQSPSTMQRRNGNSSSYCNGNDKSGGNVDGFCDARDVDAHQAPYHNGDEEAEYYNNGSKMQTTQGQKPAVAVSTATSYAKEGAYFSSAVHDPHQRDVAEEVCTISQFMHLSFQYVLS